MKRLKSPEAYALEVAGRMLSSPCRRKIDALKALLSVHPKRIILRPPDAKIGKAPNFLVADYRE